MKFLDWHHSPFQTLWDKLIKQIRGVASFQGAKFVHKLLFWTYPSDHVSLFQGVRIQWFHYNTIVFLLQRVGIREGGFTVYSGIFISEGFGIEDLYCSTLMLFV